MDEINCPRTKLLYQTDIQPELDKLDQKYKVKYYFKYVDGLLQYGDSYKLFCCRHFLNIWKEMVATEIFPIGTYWMFIVIFRGR